MMPLSLPIMSPPPAVDGTQLSGERVLVVRGDRAAGHEDQPVAGNVDHAPAGAAESGVDAENANRRPHPKALIAPLERRGEGRPARAYALILATRASETSKLA